MPLATTLSNMPESGCEPGGIRTHDTRIKKLEVFLFTDVRNGSIQLENEAYGIGIWSREFALVRTGCCQRCCQKAGTNTLVLLSNVTLISQSAGNITNLGGGVSEFSILHQTGTRSSSSLL